MGDVGQEIRRLREGKGWSQPKLAVEAGVAVSGVSQIENGRRNPNSSTLVKLAGALGVDVADLFPKAQAPLLDEREEERREREKRPDVEVDEAFFVPLEEGEEEDKVEIRFYYVRLLEGDEPILKAVRKATAEETAEIRQELEKAGRDSA